jgi:hypothetical protein
MFFFISKGIHELEEAKDLTNSSKLDLSSLAQFSHSNRPKNKETFLIKKKLF